MKNVILTPNPYRDRNFATVRSAMQILKDAGLRVSLCLPFEVDRGYELPKDLRFSRLDRELPNADAIVCFGGDGTILHTAKAATRRGIPILGVNIGTMGFLAELESSEIGELSKLATGNYKLDPRMMLDVTVQRDRDIIFHDICLNDVCITKGAVARIVYLSVECDGIQALSCGGDGVIVSTPSGSTALLPVQHHRRGGNGFPHAVLPGHLPEMAQKDPDEVYGLRRQCGVSWDASGWALPAGRDRKVLAHYRVLHDLQSGAVLLLSGDDDLHPQHGGVQ